MRLCSVRRCVPLCAELARFIDAQWAALCDERGDGFGDGDGDGDGDGAPAAPPLTILHPHHPSEGARLMAAAHAAELCWVVGYRIVLAELKAPLLQGLYRRAVDKDVVGGKPVTSVGPLAPLLSTGACRSTSFELP